MWSQGDHAFLLMYHASVLSCQQSCPAIQVYTASNVELALENATKSFISQEVEIQGSEVSYHNV